jgi:hypothetical protein
MADDDKPPPAASPQRRPSTPTERGDTTLSGSASVYSSDGHPREPVAGQRREGSDAPPDDNATNRPSTRTDRSDVTGLRGVEDDDTTAPGTSLEDDEDAFDLRDELGLRNPVKRDSGGDSSK